MAKDKENNHVDGTSQSHMDWQIFDQQNTAHEQAKAATNYPGLQTAIALSIEEQTAIALSIDEQTAIALSIEETNKVKKEKANQVDTLHDNRDNSPTAKTPISADEKSPVATDSEKNVQRHTLETRIHDLTLRGAIELPRIHDPHGDTYVYIDPPAQQPEQDNQSYESFCERYRLPILIQSRTLLCLGSSVFDTLFGSTYQHRILRRRRLVGILPNRVKYVIDLTPPMEGEEAVYLIAQLCCSDGVRKWYQASERWNVSKTLVGGQEEYEFHASLNSASNFRDNSQHNEEGSANHLSSGIKDGSSEEQHVDLDRARDSMAFASQGFSQSNPIPVEYSPVRHRSAIERVLAAVHGLDPQLDSAPKLWTTLAVAKFFDITHSSLTDYIVRWLRATPNHYFLEVLPETSLKIADGLRCHDLCRDTFAILVGEEALGTIFRSRVPDFGDRYSVYGRKREELPETFKTRIEYASKAFIDRVVSRFAILVDDGMQWVEELPEFQKLSRAGPALNDGWGTLYALKALIKEYVKGTVYSVLYTNYARMPDVDGGMSGGDDLFPRTSWIQIWTTLRPLERILTRSFWDALKFCPLFEGPDNFHLGGCMNFWTLEPGKEAQEAWLEGQEFLKISYYQLQKLVAELKPLYNRKLDDSTVLGSGTPTDIEPGREAFTRLFYGDYVERGIKKLPFWLAKHAALALENPDENGQSSSKQRQTFVLTEASHTQPDKNHHTIAEGSHSDWNKPDPATSGEPLITNDGPPFRGSTTELALRQGSADYVLPVRSQEASAKPGLTEDLLAAGNQDVLAERLFQDGLIPKEYETESSSTTFQKQNNYLLGDDFFDLRKFFGQAASYLRDQGSQMVSASDASNRAEPFTLNLTNTLVCLEDSEWKFLPLWAGGNDDGSGGVFNDDVPVSYEGFSSAGPRVHTVHPRSVDDHSSQSDYTIVGSHLGSSQPNTSLINHDGFSDSLPRGVVVSDEGSDDEWDQGYFQAQEKDTCDDAASCVTLERTYDGVAVPDRNDKWEGEEQRTRRMVAEMEVIESSTARGERLEGVMTAPEDSFDDIFSTSTEMEEDDDDETVDGRDSSEDDGMVYGWNSSGDDDTVEEEEGSGNDDDMVLV